MIDKQKTRALLEIESSGDAALFLLRQEELLKKNLEYFKKIDATLSMMSSAVSALQPLADISKLITKDYLTSLKSKEIDLSPLLEGITNLKKVIEKGDDGHSQNRLLDTLVLGFKKLEEVHQQTTEELKLSFKEANQPLIDQNIEKISLMKAKPLNEKQTVVSGGSSISSVVLRGFGAPITLGRITSTTPGTPVRITSTPTPCRRVDITALPNNGAYIYYGDVSTNATIGSERGTLLNSQNTATLSISDLSNIWFDVINSTDGVSVTYYN